MALMEGTGNDFIFYFGTTFFQELGTINNPFLINIITTLVYILGAPLLIWGVERFGRRSVLLWGIVGMTSSQFIVAIIGTAEAGKIKRH